MWLTRLRVRSMMKMKKGAEFSVVLNLVGFKLAHFGEEALISILIIIFV